MYYKHLSWAGIGMCPFGPAFGYTTDVSHLIFIAFFFQYFNSSLHLFLWYCTTPCRIHYKSLALHINFTDHMSHLTFYIFFCNSIV